MQLIILGSGTSVPHPRRAAAAHWLATESGNVLLDMGPDTGHRMAEENLDWINIDAIWISHFHLDHVGGVAPFLFGTRAAPETQQRRKPLKIIGGKGLQSLLVAMNDSNNYRLFEQPFNVDVVEVESGNELEILPGLNAGVLSTPHTKESLAIRLTDKNGTVLVYTSDTGYSEELIAFAKGAHVLLMECSFIRNKPVKTHLELEDAMRLAQHCQPRKLVLSHLYAEWDGTDVAAEARKLWPSETVEAYDGLRVEF
ncbi:MAG TPA: ribonuclease Z [Pyrinomonadaceae bacterium]|nr:ribonuclease Z [Pyrinomonadaceae bacterium]